jgi:hypothetical protein
MSIIIPTLTEITFKLPPVMTVLPREQQHNAMMERIVSANMPEELVRIMEELGNGCTEFPN